MPRVDLDTYTQPAPALIAHRNSCFVAMRTATPAHLTTERTGSRPTARQRRVPHWVGERRDLRSRWCDELAGSAEVVEDALDVDGVPDDDRVDDDREAESLLGTAKILPKPAIGRAPNHDKRPQDVMLCSSRLVPGDSRARGRIVGSATLICPRARVDSSELDQVARHGQLSAWSAEAARRLFGGAPFGLLAMGQL